MPSDLPTWKTLLSLVFLSGMKKWKQNWGGLNVLICDLVWCTICYMLDIFWIMLCSANLVVGIDYFYTYVGSMFFKVAKKSGL